MAALVPYFTMVNKEFSTKKNLEKQVEFVLVLMNESE